MAEPFDPYHVWLGIPPEDQPPHHYRLLGISLFERELRVIESAGDRQMMHLRTFQSGEHSAESQRLLNEIAKAKIVLLNAQKKAAYDGQLKRALDARKPKPAAHPAPQAEAAPDQAAAVVTPTVAPQLVGVAQYKPARKSAPRRPPFAVGIAAAAGVVLVCVVVYVATAKRAVPQPDATVAESSTGDQGKSPAPAATPTKSRQPAEPRKVEPSGRPKVAPGKPTPEPVEDPPKDPPHDPPKDPPPTDPPVPEPKTAPPDDPIAPPAKSSPDDVFALIDPVMHRIGDRWKQKGTDLQFNSTGPKHGRLIVPVVPQGSYEWTVEFSFGDSKSGCALSFPVGSKGGSPYIEIGATLGTESGLGQIKGERANDPGNPTRRPCNVTANERHTIVVKTRLLPDQQVEVSALLDGKSHIQWKGPRSALAQDKVWSLPEPVVMALGTTGSVTYHGSQLRMLDGKLARLDVRQPPDSGSEQPGQPPEFVVRQPPKDEKQPEPTGEILQRATGMVRELYQSERQEAKTEAQKGQLAGKVLQRAEETRDDPAGRYALLRLAYDLAVEAADGNLALDVVDRLVSLYVVEFDPWQRKAEVVGTLARQARRPDDHKAVVQLALTLIAQTQADDAFPVAQQLAKQALVAANKAREHAVLEQVRAAAKQVEQAAKAFQEVQAALATLKDKPDDGEAHLTAGRHYCFVKGDWETGLPHLAKSSDAPLAQAAGDDLKAGADSAARVKVADAWWDLSAKAHGAESDGVRLRAGFWYKQLLGESTDGLLRARIEKRLEEVAQISRPLPSGKMKRLVVNALGMKLAFIPSGEFRMGSSDADKYAKDDEKPQHRVRITRPFYIGVYEVTQAEFRRVMGRNPGMYAMGSPLSARGTDTSQYPVESVTFKDAVEFCVRLSRAPDELRAGRAYRLPTEAEWEFACRAGTTTTWSFGDSETDLGDYAWTSRNAKSTPHPVGEKKPNPWGLYDMHGNVAEWCLDWFDVDYYKATPLADPPGPAMGQTRVLRGGDIFSTAPRLARSAQRFGQSYYSSGTANGFRVVMIPAR